jgi:hypothetical protein
MIGRSFILALSLSLSACAATPASLPANDPKSWVVEQMPGGSVKIGSDAIVIEDVDGATVWFRQQLTAPVEISYEIAAISRGGPNDRVSDVNCFWMATDPKAPGALPAGRTGKFEDYDSLRTYYVGMGGNTNSTTRFRRYGGDGTKPLLPEHDLKDKKFLLEPNKTYRLRIVARNGVAEFWRDGEKIFSFADPAPLTSGWFGFRTVKSHLEIKNFRVSTPAR